VSALRIANLSVALDGRPIIRGATFTVRGGELVGLIGANSVGKSTLVRAVAGLIPTAGGEVCWGDRPVVAMSLPERARTLAYMPQGQMFHWNVSVRHIVALGRLPHLGPLSRMTDRDRNAIERAMDRAEVTDLADRSAMEISGGERSRVLLARALAIEAPALLADEPTAALDPYHQLHTMELLRSLAAEGQAVLAVLHDLSLAARFCDRIVMLHEGRVLADGPPSEALTAPHVETAYRITVFRSSEGPEAIVLPWERLT